MSDALKSSGVGANVANADGASAAEANAGNSPRASWRAKVSVVLFALVFAALWLGVTGTFDVQIARAVWQSYDAERRYQSVPGVVTQSRIRDLSDSEGTTYKPDVAYTYVVGGRTYSGDRIRTKDLATSNHARARRIIADYPVNAAVQVRYDPSDPARALLDPRLDGAQLFMVVFLMPFNMIAVIGLWAGGVALARRGRPPAPAGVEHTDVGASVRVHLAQASPMLVFLVSVLGVSFVSIFVVGFATKMDPSPSEAMATIAAIVALPLFITLRYAIRRSGGAYDLVIDRATRTIRLPAGLAKRGVGELGRSEIAGVEVRHTQTESDDSTTHWYTPTLVTRVGMETALARWTDEAKARRLVEFVRREMEGMR